MTRLRLKVNVPVLAVAILTGCVNSPQIPKDLDVVGFKAVPVSFEHQWDEKTHPFTGAAAIDIDGDQRHEVFVGGGQGQGDALFAWRDGGLVNVIDATGLSRLSATRGATAIDMDNDGDTDLLVARDDGVWLHLNDNGKFASQLIPVDLPTQSVPFDVAVADVDHDGDADLYVSVFIEFPAFKSATYNDPNHAKKNRLLLNNGDGSFTDITDESGTASKNNTFLSVFVDLDNDGWQDLVVSQNTGEVEIFHNQGDARFKSVRIDQGFGFWMGLAVGDIDRDGDQDLFFSNIGGSIPSFLTRGDLRDDQRGSLEWLMLRNDGAMTFTNVTEQSGLSGHGFAWGAVFEDFNFDGELDLLVAENYIKWPIHKLFKLKGKSFLGSTENDGVLRFYQADKLGLQNPYYGQSPLFVDLDGDGRKDVLWLNMAGPLRAFLNKAQGNFLTVRFPETAAYIGTRVHITVDGVDSGSRQVLNSVGMLTDQDHSLTFGLGESSAVQKLMVTYPDGASKTLRNPPINQTINWTEK